MKLLIVVLVIGTFVQQGWIVAPALMLDQALPFMRDALPGGAAVPALPNIASAAWTLVGGLLVPLAGLPEPWHGLGLAIAGLMVLVVGASAFWTLVSAVRWAAISVQRLASWFREAFI